MDDEELDDFLDDSFDDSSNLDMLFDAWEAASIASQDRYVIINMSGGRSLTFWRDPDGGIPIIRPKTVEEGLRKG